MAQVADRYGLGGRVPSYEECYALHLNLLDAESRESFREFTVQIAAGPGGSLPDEWLDAAVTNKLVRYKWKNWCLRREFFRSS